ncbi:MAG: hypothetical protein EXQ56_13645 [Acidobacteria bacterium]|nr:hypothetical protein [Acidobacteriota bacterium]
MARLSVGAMATACGLVWGFYGMMGTGVLNLIWPSYGEHFLQTMSSVYPGYHATRALGDVLIATAYGIADGGAAGCLLAVVYNFFVPDVSKEK